MRSQITRCFGSSLEITWKELAKLSAWRLEEFDRFSIFTSIRRNLFQTTSLPEQKFFDINHANSLNFTRSRKFVSDSVTSAGGSVISQSLPSASTSFNLDDEDLSEDILFKKSFAEGEKISVTGKEFAYVAKIINEIGKNKTGKKGARRFLQTELKKLKANRLNNRDLEELLIWAEAKLASNDRSSVFTYSSRIQRALFAMPGTNFSGLTTDDIEQYLDNYTTTASIENVFSSLKQFDNHLINKGLAAPGHIDWASKSLKFKTFVTIRDIITEAEFIQICETLLASESVSSAEKQRNYCLLLLLRRCGLRSGEAAALTVQNFSKNNNTQLNITDTKTRAGRRSLPLYLLMSKEELDFIKDYLKVKASASNKSFLFTDEEDLPLNAAKIGRIIERRLSSGGITGETAHGLRHAFANSLLSALWLKISSSAHGNNTFPNRFRAAISKFTRIDVEERAVTNENNIRLLMGHADLKVTFERYFHLLELVAADAVFQTEHSPEYPRENLATTYVAALLGADLEPLQKLPPDTSKEGFSSILGASISSASRL